MAALRNGGGQQTGGFCPLCGGGGKKGGLWKWVVGILAVYFLVQNMGTGSTSKGETDYKPPSQTQQDTKKCNPDALIQFGCTP